MIDESTIFMMKVALEQGATINFRGMTDDEEIEQIQREFAQYDMEIKEDESEV